MNLDTNALQQRLNTLGYPVVIDGDYGPKTRAAVIRFQRDHNLVEDGIAGEKTLAALYNKDTSHLLSQADIVNAAALLNVDIATIYAVKAVESRGNGFLSDGRPVILYERHVMRRRLKANGMSGYQITDFMQRYPNLVSTQTGGYQGGTTEHYRLDLAMTLHLSSALESCSWGLFQIMGYHWDRLGYANINDFVRAMEQSEGNQLAAFVQFILTDNRLHTALKAQDWAAFAKGYNGPGYKKNRYDSKLAEAYADHLERESVA